jgi:hypothetical protein
MEILKGFKMIFTKPKGKSQVEITRHPDPIMDNILVVNRISNKKKEMSWIIEKDLPGWINYLATEGYTEIKTIEDVESSEKNNKKKT